MKRCTSTIQGIAPILFHNVFSMNIKKPSGLTHEEWEIDDRCMRSKAYLDGEKIVLPARVILGHFIRSSKTGSGNGIKPPKKKSWTDSVKSNVIIEEPGMSMGKEYKDLKIQQSYVTVQRSKVLRAWPMLESGWEGTFSVLILDEKMMPPDALLTLLEFGGKGIGLGDYRPQYGRFNVIEWEVGDVD